MSRPICLTCQKPLARHIRVVDVAFDSFQVAEIVAAKFGAETLIVDSDAAIAARRATAQQHYENAVESFRRAELECAPGANEPEPRRYALMCAREVVANGAPDPGRYTFYVRAWRGEYGFDARGLFHSGECAQRWANQVAGKLRSEGKL